MELIDIESHFSDIGGQFLKSAFDIQSQLPNIKAYLFDWDGVFNDGSKHAGGSSVFSEVDSAGLRLLRYAHFLKFKETPLLGVVTGAHNTNAVHLMESHKGDVIYQKAIRKGEALNHFLHEFDLQPHEVCYVYDDVLDLAIARQVGLRFCVGRLANPLFLGLVVGSNMADYITASQGNEHAVREVCELLMGIMGNYTELVQEFITSQEHYSTFKTQLLKRKLQKFEFQEGKFKGF